MSEMVDRLTAIIANSDDISYEECARLCIKEMRTPTDNMLNAVNDDLEAELNWQDMIDAALWSIK